MTPLISVLLPVYDAAPTLALSLESIRRQRGVRWECIAVDDGSSDDSLACLRRVAALDSRVRVLGREHGGIVAALNAGLAECQGKYVARMDADDVMLRDRLRCQAEALERDETLGGVGCHVRIFPRSERSPGRQEYEGWLNSLQDAAQVRRDAFVECPLAHPSWMLRRSLFERYPYHARRWPEDYDLLLRLLGTAASACLAARRTMPSSVSPRARRTIWRTACSRSKRATCSGVTARRAGRWRELWPNTASNRARSWSCTRVAWGRRSRVLQ
jgi:hypothetical protein